jgi:hypothetical protein
MKKQCAEKGCKSKARARGLCSNHYQKAARMGLLSRFPTEGKKEQMRAVHVTKATGAEEQVKREQGLVEATLKDVAVQLFLLGEDRAAAHVRAMFCKPQLYLAA